MDANQALYFSLGPINRGTSRCHRYLSIGKIMKKFLATLAIVSVLATDRAFAGPDDDVKATFDRFVVAQNAHDISALREVLLDSPNFLLVSRGAPFWGRDAALKRFEALYQGTWKISPDTANLKVIMLNDTTAQLFVPVMFNIGPSGQPAPDTRFLVNQTLVKTPSGWRIASIMPIPVPPPTPAAVPAK
jgi:hypothetical protein